jgi:hypothetical protein
LKAISSFSYCNLYKNIEILFPKERSLFVHKVLKKT